MKVIDLFNKIANGEEVPRKFTYNGYLWEYDINNKMWFYYFGEGKNHRFDKLFYLNMCLNDEVEILPDEEDEFIDIEEIKLTSDGDIKGYYNGETHHITTNIKDKEVYIKLLNQLIKNQKLIINKLKEEGK